MLCFGLQKSGKKDDVSTFSFSRNWRPSSRIREPVSYSLYQERMKDLGRIPAINQKVALISFNVRALNTREIMRSKDAQAFPLRHWFIGV